MKKLTAISALLWMLYLTVKFAEVKSTTEIPVGFPCENIPNFCDRVNCAPPKNCENGIIVDGGGNCGCCKACITYQDAGETCTGMAEVPALLPEGVIAQYYEYSTCLPGLQCDTTTMQCQAFPSDGSPGPSPEGFKDCTYHEYECKDYEWEGKPSCNFYGDYDYKSCKGTSNPRCFCVDADGNTIFGRLPEGSDNATCACSRAVYELRNSYADSPDYESYQAVSYFMLCDATGDFMPLQCWNDVCFCVDPYTKTMDSEAVPIAGIQALPCWDKKLYNVTYYTACTSEYLKQSSIVKEQSLKGMEITPLDLPNCDPDGTYSYKQFQSNAYYCSDRTGTQIASYSTQEYDDYQEMVCNCARDSFYSDGLPDSGRGYKCNAYGNYVQKYCSQDVCFCLDSDGQQCSNTFSSEYDYVDCVSILQPTTVVQMARWTKSMWAE